MRIVQADTQQIRKGRNTLGGAVGAVRVGRYHDGFTFQEGTTPHHQLGVGDMRTHDCRLDTSGSFFRSLLDRTGD